MRHSLRSRTKVRDDTKSKEEDMQRNCYDQTAPLVKSRQVGFAPKLITRLELVRSTSRNRFEANNADHTKIDVVPKRYRYLAAVARLFVS